MDGMRGGGAPIDKAPTSPAGVFARMPLGICGFRWPRREYRPGWCAAEAPGGSEWDKRPGCSCSR